MAVGGGAFLHDDGGVQKIARKIQAGAIEKGYGGIWIIKIEAESIAVINSKEKQRAWGQKQTAAGVNWSPWASKETVIGVIFKIAKWSGRKKQRYPIRQTSLKPQSYGDTIGLTRKRQPVLAWWPERKS